MSVIGTAVDAPSSDLALGILGLLALAAGRPAPQADEWERAGAQGGASDGRERPALLAEQPAVELETVRERAAASGPLPATRIAQLVAGTYDSLWGRDSSGRARRMAVLRGRVRHRSRGIGA